MLSRCALASPISCAGACLDAAGTPFGSTSCSPPASKAACSRAVCTSGRITSLPSASICAVCNEVLGEMPPVRVRGTQALGTCEGALSSEAATLSAAVGFRPVPSTRFSAPADNALIATTDADRTSESAGRVSSCCPGTDVASAASSSITRVAAGLAIGAASHAGTSSAASLASLWAGNAASEALGTLGTDTAASAGRIFSVASAAIAASEALRMLAPVPEPAGRILSIVPVGIPVPEPL
mmetsp:Transcript_29010/g.63124  ORF Transcript_29010/g.63124 Transcript_29010/m.63124 type:complete len:240 (-) Transcript_29010:338-1057(-)